jgi:hypothetical protein
MPSAQALPSSCWRVCVLGLKEGRERGLVMYSAPALAGIWSLLTFYHLTYGFILLLPTATLLLWEDERSERSAASWLFWPLQVWLMLDPRTLWRYAAMWFPLPPLLEGVSLHADRALMLVLFTCMAVFGRRRTALLQTRERGSTQTL